MCLDPYHALVGDHSYCAPPGSSASDETLDENRDLSWLHLPQPSPPAPKVWEVPGEPQPTYEQLRDVMLYMGGPVNYDRYVHPAICRRLVELGLVSDRPGGALEFTPLGADVYSSLTAGNEAPELLDGRTGPDPRSLS